MDKKYFVADPELAQALQSVNDLIDHRIQINNQDLQKALRRMASNGGKYLRPAFCLLFAKITNPTDWSSERLIKVAASLEILHMATLIHDDVIDDSPERRGAVSIQAAFGKDTAVYSGDLLFTVFFDLLVESMSGSPFLRTNAMAMRHILAGELGQMGLRFNQQQTLLQYFRNVNGKTATLFSLAAQEGTSFSGGDVQETRLAKRIGRLIGISFQILDDTLDYSDGSQLNKPVLEDLATGVYSLPLLLVLQDHHDELAPFLDKRRQMTRDDMQSVQSIVQYYHGSQQAQVIAGKFTNKALTLIDRLPQSSSQRLLKHLTQKLLTRAQ